MPTRGARSPRSAGAGARQVELVPVGTAPETATSFQARFLEEHARLHTLNLGVKPTPEGKRFIIVANLRKARVNANGGDAGAAEREMLSVLQYAFDHPTDYMRKNNAFTVNAICSANVYDGLLAAMNGNGGGGAPLLTAKGMKNLEAAQLAIARHRQRVQEGRA